MGGIDSMTPELPPEEKLLRLIRGKPRKSDTVSIKKAQANKRSHPPDKSTSSSALLNIFSFKRICFILSLFIILAIVYSIFELLFKASPLDLEQVTPSSSPAIIEEGSIKSLFSQPYSHYSEQFNKRDIFNAPFLSAKGAIVPLNASLDERIANLSLVGIVLDETPQAIIEDTAEKKTYFLNKGDSIGEIKVEDILESKVILLYDEEEFELTP